MPGYLWVYGPNDVERIGPDHARWSPARLGALSADLERAVTAEGVTVIRLPEVYGPGVRRGWLGKAFERALAGSAVWFPGDLDRPVEYLYVEDAARALVAPLGRRASRGREYTAPGHTVTTPREFASLIFQAAGKEGRLRSLRLGWLRGRALLGPNGWAQRGLTYLYANTILLDGTRVREELGWAPEVDYPEGIRRTVRWWRERGPSRRRAAG